MGASIVVQTPVGSVFTYAKAARLPSVAVDAPSPLRINSDSSTSPDAPAFTLEIALLVTRREFLSIKRKLRKLGGGDMGAGLIHLMNEEEA